MKKLLFLLSSFLLLFVALGQIPAGYYTAAEGKKNTELKEALFEIISDGYVQRTYNQLWTDFKITDKRPDNDKYVWDIYSNCDFIFGSHQDNGGNAPGECYYYNREHSVPNSWFGVQNQSPMYTDLFHMYPTDKYVNAQRANLPYGETNGPTTYGNGGKKGNCTFPGYTSTVYEPADEYKGDLARTYFYMATRYLDINFSQKDGGKIMFTYNTTCDLSEYANELLLKWHRNDPVSEKETNRNNAIYGIQKNRNPFIDYPELVEHIWGNLKDVAWNGLAIPDEPAEPSIIITRKDAGISIEGATPDTEVEIYSITGQKVKEPSKKHDYISLYNLQRGIYIVKVGECVVKIVW
jgi:endonuclease I